MHPLPLIPVITDIFELLILTGTLDDYVGGTTARTHRQHRRPLR